VCSSDLCKAGQTKDCIGGQANVLLLPAAPAASAPASHP
jgi:hypothetical protein